LTPSVQVGPPPELLEDAPLLEALLLDDALLLLETLELLAEAPPAPPLPDDEAEAPLTPRPPVPSGSPSSRPMIALQPAPTSAIWSANQNLLEATISIHRP
jgi:hypothetical protein